MAPVDLVDFTSYDLGRLQAALLEVQTELGRDAYGIPHLWANAQRLLPWDHRFLRCWNDPSFSTRYEWLRARLVPAEATPEYPIGEILTALAALVDERVALDEGAF